MARTHLYLLALVALGATLAHAEVPPYIRTCGRRNPKLSECIKESVYILIPTLRHGIPELDVPPLEPLDIDRIPLADIADFKAIAHNVKMGGLSNFTMNSLQVDLNKGEIQLDMFFPYVTLKADYDVQAKVIVPINEQGPIDIKSENTKAKATLKMKKVEHRGRTYLYFSSMTCQILVHDYTANFKPGETANPLVEAINNVLVTSQKEIIESLRPHLETAFSTKILDVANRVCKHFTYDELFPDHA